MILPSDSSSAIPRAPVRGEVRRRDYRNFAPLALLLALPAAAQDFPPLSGRVVDAAQLLSPAQEADLTRLSQGVERASGRQFVVATLPDLQGYPIEDYGYRLGRAWGIGEKGANTGILLLVAPAERRVRIEVGYGLEPIMTDALSSRIINDTVLPRFRAGDMPGGILAGAERVAEQLRLPPEAAEARAQQPPPVRHAQTGGGADTSALIFLLILFVFLFVAVPMLRGRSHGRRYRRGGAPVVIWGSGIGGGGGWSGGSGGWSGGGGGGGGFTGGGGSFGGGGASGSW